MASSIRIVQDHSNKLAEDDNETVASSETSSTEKECVTFTSKDASSSSNTNRNLRRRKKRSHSAPTPVIRRFNIPSNRRYKLLFEQHYKVEQQEGENQRALLSGVPNYDNDLARDLHDFFNLIVLVPICVLNVLNWDWESFMQQIMTVAGGEGAAAAGGTVPFVHAWTGEYFAMFFWSTVAYFIADLLWVTIVPSCVKSPGTIIQHHIAVLLYLIIPFKLPKLRFLMGVCMSVELNTWFLIARRVFNKQGFSPWIWTLDIPYLFISVRVKLISIFFYITWITIRCIVYPYVLYLLAFPLLADKGYVDEKHAIRVAVFLQTVFCILNAQWSLQLFNSKLKQWRQNGETKIETGL